MQRVERLSPIAVLVCAAAILLPGLASFGVWDPWELATADAARQLNDGQPLPLPMDARVVAASAGFRILGLQEWAGRLPIALCGLGLVGLLMFVGGRIVDRRTGVYAAAIVASTPIFALNSRPIFGHAPSFLLQAATGLSLAMALLRGRTPARERLAWFVVALAAGALSALDAGALRGVLPPLLASTAALALRRSPTEGSDRTHRTLSALLMVACGVTLAGVLVTVGRDVHAPSVWTGGTPMLRVSPPFESSMKHVFHAFAPWSTMLPLAAGAMLWTEVGDERRAWILWLNLWAIAGYGAHTVYASRYGHDSAFLPVAALALLVAITLRELETSTRPQWAAAIGSAMLCVLLIRDFASNPGSAVEALALADLKPPEGYHPKAAWAGLLGGFALLLVLVLGGGPEHRPSPAAQWRAIRTQWSSSRGAKVWLGLAALVLTLVVVAAVAAAAAPKQVGLTTVASKWVRRAGLLPLVVAAIAVLVPMVRHYYTRLGNRRVWPLLLSGLLLGIYASQVFLPRLSADYSPRSVFETYARLASAGEPLAQYKISGRAAAYYGKGTVSEVGNLQALVKHLDSKTRTWAVLPGDELPRLDRLYRRHSGRHVFAADTKSAKAVLVSSAPIDGHDDQNYLAKAVLERAPQNLQTPLETLFDDKIKLLGYDLKLPHEGYVGGGEKLEITWYFEALKPISGNYRVFVHIDGEDRVHGDHVPVDGKYPPRLWDRGDVVMDRHVVDIPSSTKAGTYAIYVGFYSGAKRLEVKAGPTDEADRAKAGVLRIQ